MGFTTTMRDRSQSAQTEIHTFNHVRQAVATPEDTGKHNLDFVILPPHPPVLRLQKNPPKQKKHENENNLAQTGEWQSANRDFS